MDSVILRFAIIFLMTVGTDFALTVSELTGEWRSGTIIGNSNVGASPSCSAFNWIERTVTISAVPGKPDLIRGLWQAKTSSIWLQSDGARCRWGDEQVFAPSADATNVYSLNGLLSDSSGTVRITTEFLSCFGVLCPPVPPPAFTALLTQTFSMDNGTLVETANSGPNGSRMKFIRTGEFIDEAMTGVPLGNEAIRMLDTGRFDEFLSRLATQALRDRLSAGQLARSWPEMRSHLGEVLTRVPLAQSYASNPSSDPKTNDEYLLFIRGVQTAKQFRLGELVVMKWEGKQWKLDLITYY
jgi:hypothetical protein